MSAFLFKVVKMRQLMQLQRKLLYVIHCQGAHRWMGQFNAVICSIQHKYCQTFTCTQPTLLWSTKLHFLSQHCLMYSITVVMFESLYYNDTMTAGNITMSPKKNTVLSS